MEEKISEKYRKIVGNKLYHYSPYENVDEIEKHMKLYSSTNIKENNIKVAYFTNELSRQLDKRIGLNNYVFLVFREDHPLIHKVRQSGLKLLKISLDISILDIPGVLISDRVANDSNANFFTPEHALKLLKIEYCKGYISDRNIWDEVKKYEILVPNNIDLNLY